MFTSKPAETYDCFPRLTLVCNSRWKRASDRQRIAMLFSDLIIAKTPRSGSRHRLSRLCLALTLMPLLAVPLNAARNPEPPQRISLSPLGLQTVSERYLLQGATMLTVDFVDKTHLLVTFGISRLMARLPECPPDDEDRTVKAVLLELPSGKELASTEWRFHDLGQYLWNLGDGHFMLRNRDTLTTFTPLQNLAAKPFADQPFLHFNRRIEAIVVSADHDLLTIETIKPKPHAAPDPMLQVSAQTGTAASKNLSSDPAIPGLKRRGPESAAEAQPPVEVNFLSLIRHDASEIEDSHPLSTHPIAGSNPPNRLGARLEARIRTEKPVTVPITTEGYLETQAASHDGVLFHFITYTGKDINLGDFPTSCNPRPTFISHSEFVTYGCRGADDSLDLTGFNLRGDMIWQINFTDSQAYPSFASAPAAGRFAFSRTITTSNVFGSETPSMSQLTAQEIRVVQMYNGKQLLRAVATPIQRAGQNYALSPDGLTLAVFHDTPAPPPAPGEKPAHDTGIELYKLPALSSKDVAEIKIESAMAPPTANVPMRFSLKEIKEALESKPTVPGSNDVDSKIVGDHVDKQVAPNSTADERIAGDAPSKPSSATASSERDAQRNRPSAANIPTSDAAPACANLTDPTVAACPVSLNPKPTAVPAQSESEATPEPETRRKPPTLYEPAPAASPPQ